MRSTKLSYAPRKKREEKGTRLVFDMSYCVMPNHWHFVPRPVQDGQMTMFLRLGGDMATMRWHPHYYTAGTGQTSLLAAFDFNGEGHIDIADFGQFSLRFFTVLP